MKTYLIENYSPDMKFDENSLIVALTPEVCYHLDKAGIDYSIIEDYYDEVELSNETDDCLQLVLQWIGELDKFLQDNIKGLDLKIATIYEWYLKRMIIDTLYIRCYALNRLFEAIKPLDIVFISHKPEEPHLNYRFEYYGRSYYSQVIPVLCSEKNIPLTSVFLEPDNKYVKEIKSVSHGENLINRLRRTLYQSATVRRMHFIYKYFSKRHFLKHKSHQGLNIFMLKTTHIGTDFVIDALRRGHNVYQLSGDFIVKYFPLGTRGHLDLKAEYKDKVMDLNNSIWENTASLLESHDLIKWFNEKCQLDVSEIILSKLRHFISTVCPEIIGYFRVLTEFYRKDRIDILFTSSVSPLIEYAALAAANHQDYIKTICITHGDEIISGKTWGLEEIKNYDVNIASNIETKKYYRRLSSESNSSTKVYSSPHRLLGIKKIYHLRQKRKANAKKRIIYLTTFMMWDIRTMDNLGLPDTWYYKFQKSLIEYFSAKSNYTFVWKGLPQSDAIYNPIPNFIADNNYRNIEIATNPFVEHLLSADRVICDLPSTGFYESVIAGVPTMSLYHKALIVRKSAVDYFGNLVKPFSDVPEAIKHIDEFLNSDPESYKTTIDMENNSVLDILEEIGKGKTDE